MQNIQIQPAAGQEFTININSVRYDLRFKLIAPGVVAYDIDIDQQPVISGFRVTPGTLLIPYPALERDGNFYLYVPNGEDVDYQQFGQSQLLYYLNADEVAEVRNVD